MVAVGIMAVLACVLFLAPYASARVAIDSDVVPSSGDFDSKFTYIANLTSPIDAHGNVSLIIGSDYDNPSINLSYNLMEMESDCRYGNIINIPSGEVCTVSKEVYFTDPALMQGDFKNWTKKATPCEWDKAWYQINFTGWPFKDEKSEYEQGSPILAFREPKIKLNCPRSVAWCEDFIFTVRVEDKFGGTVDIWIYLDNRSLFDDSITVPPGGGVYPYKERPFNVSMVYNTSTVVFNYTTNGCGDKNISQEVHILPIPCPEITAYLEGDQLFETTENKENIRYVEKSNSSLPFKAKITDYVGSANVTLKLVVNNDSSEWHNHSWNETLTGTIGDETTKTYKYDIPFEKEEKKFTIFLNYSNEMPIKNCVYNCTYNLTIIPLDIEFENVTVDPKYGYWNDEFKYTVWINASKDLTFALNVFDPCLETWPWRLAGNRTYNKNGGKTLNWTIDGDTIFSENCSGKSKFYFEYEGKETEVYPGPNLGLNGYENHNGPSPKKPPEFNNGTTNPKVTIYCNWSQSSTPCNYSVNVTTKDEYKVRLLVKDPTGEWIRKRDNEISGTTKNITWHDTKPFQSLNIDNISQYIDNGTRANFTFEYNGESYKEEFRGPLLVAAFKEPKIELMTGDEEINYNDPFNYSINVYGSKRLNITLMYRENPNGEWITDGIDVPTRQYNNTFNWTSPPLKWGCRAIKLWAEVKMEVEIEGEQKHIKVD
jgi:hypothetical protein